MRNCNLKLITAAICFLVSLSSCTQSGNQQAGDGLILAQKGISSFEECAAAGYAVRRSFPAQCMTPDGRTFIQGSDAISVPDAGQQELTVCKNLCGDGQCQEIVCMAVGCPCAETHDSCPQDCRE